MFIKSTCILLLSLSIVIGHEDASLVEKQIAAKCCPKGEIITTGSNLTCIHQEISTELHSTSTVKYLDKCLKDGDVTNLFKLINERVERISASLACIDLLHDPEEDFPVPIILHCRENRDDNARLKIPKIPKFRICCKRGNIYDMKRRDCIPTSLGVIDTADYISKIISDNTLSELVSFVRGPPQCKHAIVNYVIDSKRDLKILQNGTIRVLIPSDDDGSVLLTDENSCLDGVTSSELMTVRLCTGPKYCQTNSCVRKCCPEGEMRIGAQCQTIPSSMPLGEFHSELQKFSAVSVNSTSTWQPFDASDYGLIVGNLTCQYGMFALAPDENPTIDVHGHIHADDKSGHKEYRHHEYCMEILYDVFGYENGLSTGVCFPPDLEPEQPRWRFGINAALELTSCMFLLITFLVYIFLPVLQNLHGKTLMSHVASLFVAYACLAAIGLMELPDTKSPPLYGNIECKFVGYTMLFTFLAAFSWLNVMCFDIWWTFGGLRRAASIGGKGQTQRKRFFLYSLYAWGISFTLACLGVAADYTNIIEEHFRPNIGIETCWFRQSAHNYGTVIFFIGPISLQLVVNIIFFISTSLYCSRVKAEITRVMIPASDPKSRRFHSAKSKLILNIKLFIVMGISWIMEIISTFLNSYATNLHWRLEFFYVSDAINCLQGLLIFILFVLKSKVYHALKLRLSRKKTNTAGNLTTTLQDPCRVRKSASCSTLMSNFAVNVTP